MLEAKNMDSFFKKETCDRCGKSLNNGRIMSMYNEDCICIDCKDKEIKRKDYQEAVDADMKEIKKGNYNYKGLERKK